MNAPEGRRRGLGFSYAPVPHAVIRAMRAGLSLVDLAILVVLYDRADYGALRARRETPWMTLVQLAEAIGWKGSTEALSRRLRRLRDRPEGWFSYRVEGGRGRYVFTLRPDAGIVSDLCPTSGGDECPTSEASRSGMAAGIAGPTTGSFVRPRGRGVSGSCPTSAGDCPTSGPPGSRIGAGEIAGGTEDLVRPPQTFRGLQPLAEHGERLPPSARSGAGVLLGDSGYPETLHAAAGAVTARERTTLLALHRRLVAVDRRADLEADDALNGDGG